MREREIKRDRDKGKDRKRGTTVQLLNGCQLYWGLASERVGKRQGREREAKR